MHAPSIISLLVSGLAASTVAGSELSAPGTALARHAVAFVAIAVVPTLAFPVDVAIESRHHKGKTASTNCNRSVNGEANDLEVRHHQGKTSTNTNTNTNTNNDNNNSTCN